MYPPQVAFQGFYRHAIAANRRAGDYNSSMDTTTEEYDPRYLGGILFFNDRDFFEAHEVWEGLWMTLSGPERKFIQGLIQAAVALYHFGNGNLRGAIKLFHSGRAYMEGCGSSYKGLDIIGFWQAMARCFEEVLASPDPDRSLRPREELIPTIALQPPPESWPDPATFVSEDE